MPKTLYVLATADIYPYVVEIEKRNHVLYEYVPVQKTNDKGKVETNYSKKLIGYYQNLGVLFSGFGPAWFALANPGKVYTLKTFRKFYEQFQDSRKETFCNAEWLLDHFNNPPTVPHKTIDMQTSITIRDIALHPFEIDIDIKGRVILVEQMEHTDEDGQLKTRRVVRAHPFTVESAIALVARTKTTRMSKGQVVTLSQYHKAMLSLGRYFSGQRWVMPVMTGESDVVELMKAYDNMHAEAREAGITDGVNEEEEEDTDD